MNTYEITIGVFMDELTTGAVEHYKVKVNTLFEAAHLAEEIKFSAQVKGAKGEYKSMRREIVRVQRIA